MMNTRKKTRLILCMLCLFLNALLHIEPNWSLLFTGEKVSFICDLREGNDTDWNYSFSRNDHLFTTNRTVNRYKSSSLTRGDSGEYQCVADHKIRPVTRESNKVSVTVSGVPRPVLTVSPSWTSPGDSVTLTCSVEPPSAGWRFFWFKAVPDMSHYYTFELLPGGTTGTEQGSYILHGQTHTAGYVCRAGRGDPVFYTQYSDVKFVWSGGEFVQTFIFLHKGINVLFVLTLFVLCVSPNDVSSAVNPAASLTVSPHRLQHFSTESLSLICEGNSTEWRVMKADEDGDVSICLKWGEMTGSTCNTDTRASSGVYWCESETQFSNAANITIHRGDVILVSPVHPVTEGHSVTLGCKLRTENLLYNVDFYKNDKLIPNPVRGELLISAVTKSDEGFYKCRGRKSPQGLETLTSAESWLSVKYPEEAASSSVFLVPLVVGLVSGVLLIILLLLFLRRYRKSEASSLSRSQRTNQSAATDHMINQDESSLTYSVVELKHLKKKEKHDEPDESPVYSDVRIASAADYVTYAQVHPPTGKKSNEGKSRCAAEEETVYSEVKPGTFDQ
uniref:Ig-like domain-containing protein n=1 Tax=Gasterosteus aculeatus aculeatus TaxID=481459 RepID=A0AAQ4NSF2_GASAC